MNENFITTYNCSRLDIKLYHNGVWLDKQKGFFVHQVFECFFFSSFINFISIFLKIKLMVLFTTNYVDILILNLQLSKIFIRLCARQAISVFLKKVEKRQAKSVFLFKNLRMSVFVSSNAWKKYFDIKIWEFFEDKIKMWAYYL